MARMYLFAALVAVAFLVLLFACAGGVALAQALFAPR